MKKSRIITLFAFVALIFLGASCNKEKMELRRTAYFYTELHDSIDVMTLTVDDKLIGDINYVEGGITSFTDKDNGLKHTFDKKKNHVVVKNSTGETVVDLILIMSTLRTSVSVEETTGSIFTSSWDNGDQIGTLINVTQ